MRQKAQLLGNAPVVENELHAGFSRFATATPDNTANLTFEPNLDAGVALRSLACTTRLSCPTTPRWGQDGAGTSGKGVPSPVNPTFDAEPNSLLSGFLWVGLLRIMDTLARPVTPEVAGSSPVAPVSRNACKLATSVARLGCDLSLRGPIVARCPRDKMPAKR
jgi:hypothetical protein